MDRNVTIKEKLVDPAIESGDLAALEKAISIWKRTAEAESKERDITHSSTKVRSEKVRFWVPILVPMLTSVALIATLIFQMHQYQENVRQTTQTAEDTAWREVLRGAQNANGLQGLFSLSLMKGFLDSPRYGKSAREISISLLGRIADPDAFEVLFPELLKRTSWENFNDIARLNAYLSRGYGQADNEAKRHKPPPVSNGPFHVMDPIDAKNAYDEELGNVQEAMIGFMKSHTFDPDRAKSKLDFTYSAFGSDDLTGLDFSGSILRETNFYRCTIDDANFSEVANYDYSGWEQTAWWRAGKMDIGLIDYLEKYYPFKPSNKYLNDQTKTIQAYKDAVSRLRKASANNE